MQLTKLDKTKKAIIEAKSIDEIKDIRDKAEAIRAYTKQVGDSLEIQNYAAEIKIRAERRAGEMLADMEKQQGARGTGKKVELHDATPPALSDLGIEKTQSHRWQQIARIPEDRFEQELNKEKAKQKELTSVHFQRVASSLKKEKIKEELDNPELPDKKTKKYRVIYADPPWNYGNAIDKAMPGTTVPTTYYPTMTIDEICNLEIEKIASDNSVLFLWTTSPLLENAFEVINAWGFKYKTSIIWDKVKHNFGYYVSVRHELLLIATRGSCLPDIKELHNSVISIERTKHSEKPAYFRELIDKLYTHGKKIELFARDKSKGWDVWGNQIK